CRYPLELDGLAPLGRWIVARRISIYCSVATLFRQFVRTLGGERFTDLRLIKLGGEVVFRSDFEAFRRCFEPGTLLSCGLAATEVGAIRQFFLDHRSTVDDLRVPCGHPVDGVEVLIVDERACELPRGSVGEIAVRSRYLSPGYWRRPERNERVFVPDPADPTRRVYLTGDLGYVRDDGQLIHAGRKDHQVKIRGNRVEIPEVEAALAELRGVRDAAVTLLADPERGNRLHAFVATGGERATEAELRQSLAGCLPAFMIPSAFTIVERLPLLPNGKIDRARLAEIEAPPEPAVASAGLAQSATARELACLWDELLDRPAGPDDDFFEAGGDSLALLQLMVAIEHRFGVRFPLNVILDCPSIRSLAARIDARRSGGDRAETLAPITDDESDEIALSVMPIQPAGELPPLFFVAPAGGTVLPYYRLAHLLGRSQPFFGLQVAPPARRGQPFDIADVARRFLRMIDRLVPSGPCRFGGWSFGGFVAWEMAAQARRSALDVETVLLVDTDATIAGHEPQGLDRFKGLLTVLQMFRHSRPFLREIIYVRLAANMRRQGADAPAGRLARLAWHAGIKHADVSEVIGADPRLLDLQFVPVRGMANLRSYMRSIHAFTPPVVAQRVDLFMPTVDVGRRERLHARAVADRWSELSSGRLHHHPLTGNHFTIFHPPHIERMAAIMGQLLRCGAPPLEPAAGARPAAAGAASSD
ncbi:MAG TPA: thioesterase domain-containing protein, partial [Candidatus Polarisedimenticolaceae bacterium]|nr:thioesterase domain-containing protein [Candidatus Polarisedimenticolaceae bacterium]